MSALLQAKAMIRPNAAQCMTSQRGVHAVLREAEQSISAEVLRRWSQASGFLGPARRLVLLCGHPRSGTTLLEQVLDSHPEIRSAEESSVFFQEVYLPLRRDLQNTPAMLAVLESASPARLKELRDVYFHCLEGFLGEPVGERLVLDKNPSLTALVPAFARVFPEAKFLVALRDPRDVCLSCFMQPLPLNDTSSSFLSLEGTVAEYISLMGLWQAVGPRLQNPHLQVRYEDVVENLESASRRALDFLGVPWDERVLRFDEHAREKLVRSPTYADVAQPVFQGAVGRWRNYQKHLEPHLARLAPFIKAFGYD